MISMTFHLALMFSFPPPPYLMISMNIIMLKISSQRLIEQLISPSCDYSYPILLKVVLQKAIMKYLSS